MNTATLSHPAQAAKPEPIRFSVYLKGGAIAGILAALVNNVWNVVSPFLGAARLPKVVNLMSVTLASILPALVASVGLWIAVKLFKQKGAMIFTIGAFALGLLSVIPNFKSTLPDGTASPDGFALLTVPMHLAAAVLIVFVLLRTVRKAV